MEIEKISNVVKESFEKICMDKEIIFNCDNDLIELGYIDSFDIINIFSDINSKLDICISPVKYKVSEINTINKIINLIYIELKK